MNIDNDQIVRNKLQQCLERGYFRTVDLFSGCGGMTLGFHRAGFKCVASVEIDKDARLSHDTNFNYPLDEDSYRSYGDITSLQPEEAISHLHTQSQEDTPVDVVIGGPPCQAFSRLGRAALWRLAGRDHAHGEDKRATMYEYYLEYIAKLKPLAFIMENVREIGKHINKNIAEEIALTAEDMGYEVRYTLLNAVWFGVPQLRERAFIIGIHKALDVIPSFPSITHLYQLPVGYSTSRAGTGHVEFLKPHDHYVDHLEYSNKTFPAITASNAFADLPPIFYHLDGRKGKGLPRDPDSQSNYTSDGNSFTNMMRNWPGFKGDPSKFTGHVIRYTPRDYEIFKRMPHGGMFPEALETAEKIFLEKLEKLENEIGKKIKRNSSEWEELRKSIVPPYKPHRYPNKFRKMWPDHPARTLPAHIGKDSYSHIHYDSKQARCISLREAARLQSFPDGFKFVGSMNSRLKQIGNAVPPLLAYAVASHLSKELTRVAQLLQPNLVSCIGSK